MRLACVGHARCGYHVSLCIPIPSPEQSSVLLFGQASLVSCEQLKPYVSEMLGEGAHHYHSS